MSKTLHAQWTLTHQALEKLLACLSPDRDEAGKQYEAIRIKLVRYFERREIDSVEDRADDVINRVARRIDEGQHIDNVIAYAYRVAYLVFLEALKEPEQAELDWDTAPAPTPEPPLEETEQDIRQRCFDDCLAKLTDESRNLILMYYQEDGRAKIDLRKRLANKLTIQLNALRIRAHRIRVGLEECIEECRARHALVRNVTG
ncbi:MAG: hypothetical protein QOH71_1364 [Blastocatellia bacterium]|jgi:DNA-directed RNA polymerase specialized sigma24 family protein|nr:hypothetical protein [Blastocatellia bacterium]